MSKYTVQLGKSAPKPIAFEIFDENEQAAKKQPPKRLLERKNEQTNQNVTAEELKQRLERAEEKRKEVLNEKVQKAKETSNKLAPFKT